MSGATTNLIRCTHSTRIAAPVERVYALIADVTRWPAVFGPTVYVEHLARTENEERFQIWATVNGAVSTWTSRRHLDPAGLRVRFEQERSQAPVAAMGGEWSFRPDRSGNGCEVVLDHHFSAVDGDPSAIEWISTALDRNSEAELDALRRIAELGEPLEEILFSFSDVVHTTGEVADAYEFLLRGDMWSQRLPHVRDATMTEDEQGVQELTMVTLTADGDQHTTRSTRVPLPGTRLVYKQHRMPALLLGHSGLWTCAEDGTLTARHLVAVNPAAVTEVLGERATLADAREFLRNALGNNSRATLAHARAHAEGQ
jgi:ribosome-associated toxin RatA of RatAB toxin-antitoxin module